MKFTTTSTTAILLLFLALIGSFARDTPTDWPDFPPAQGGAAGSCPSALLGVKLGCARDVIAFVRTGKFEASPDCCKALAEAKEKCTFNGSEMYGNPFFQHALDHCCLNAAAPAPSYASLGNN